MSKASEWAAKGDLAEFPKPEFVHTFRYPLHTAEVYQYGVGAGLVITRDVTMTPQRALAFADWIRDVFGEPAPAPEAAP